MSSGTVDSVQLLSRLEDALVPPTTAASELPDGADLSFERTLSRKLARSLDTHADRVLALVTKVLAWSHGEAVQLDGDLVRDGEYRNVVDWCEPLLEHADDAIERHFGIGKHKQQSHTSAPGQASTLSAALNAAGKQQQPKLASSILHAVNLEKPQLAFPERLKLRAPLLDASAQAQPLWTPVLRLKPNATVKPVDWLEAELHTPTDKFQLVTGTSPPSYMRYKHPYSAELGELTPPQSLFLAPAEPVRPTPTSFDEVSFSMVSDQDGLTRMINEIRKVGENETKRQLAIDLEHHDHRSWAGFTCLMQLSTRDKDYVIDVLEPTVRDNLERLNVFLTDPSWVKVFHGAHSDMIWLQRDFGLYVVGLFDTYHATHVLGYQQHSLASLLQRFVGFEADKRYQIADWRIRPLPQEMLHYARSDTHFLLDVYDHLRLQLLAKEKQRDASSSSTLEEPAPLLDVYNRSIETSSNVFSITPYDAETGHYESGWLQILARRQQLKAYATARAIPTLPIKTGWGPNEVKLEILKAVHAWRERVARELDEGVRYIMSNDGLWSIADKKPVDGVELLKVLGARNNGVSEIVRKRKDEVVRIVRSVVEQYDDTRESADEVVVTFEDGLARQGGTDVPAVRPVAGLWNTDANATASSSTAVSAASSSTLFGREDKSTKRQATSVASARPLVSITKTSSFFGSSQTTKSKGKQTDESSVAQVVERVYSSLVLGGGLATSLRGQIVPTSVAVVEERMDVDPKQPIAPVDDENRSAALTGDHTFAKPSGAMTASQETSRRSTPAGDDVLIVSSVKDDKPKKRKATFDATQVDGSEKSAKTKKEKKVKMEKGGRAAPAPFDYEKAKSVLDAEPDFVKESVSSTGNSKKGAKKAKKGDKVGGGGGFQLDQSAFKRPLTTAPKQGKGNAQRTF
ncbi:exosome nuclease subunit [Microbotryomycetes sp. JL201]|nr:exosome nuclease subunit [Microbotryomycetes sp. JL201]